MRYIFNILIVSILLFTSCKKEQDKIVISKEFQNKEWSRFEYLMGEFDVKDQTSKFNVVMEVNVTDGYPSAYANNNDESRLLFNLTIKDPNGDNSRSRNFQFSLKDKDGNWKAENNDGTYVFKLPLYDEMIFGQTGLHVFKIENKYPKDPLYGIESINLKCVSAK